MDQLWKIGAHLRCQVWVCCRSHPAGCSGCVWHHSRTLWESTPTSCWTPRRHHQTERSCREVRESEREQEKEKMGGKERYLSRKVGHIYGSAVLQHPNCKHVGESSRAGRVISRKSAFIPLFYVKEHNVSLSWPWAILIQLDKHENVVY